MGYTLPKICNTADNFKLLKAVRGFDAYLAPTRAANSKDFDFGCQFTNWLAGEPSNHADEEDCIQFVADQGDNRDGKWNDIACRHEASVVCMVPTLVVKKANMERAVKGYCAFKQSQSPGFDCDAPSPIPFPTPKELTDEIRRVCVKNRGAYAMHWTLIRVRDNGESLNAGRSRTYPNPQEQCFDGSQAAFKNFDVMKGRACAVAGNCVNLDAPHFKYHERSFLQANYRCEGSTISITCRFEGLVTVGQNGQGGRRMELPAPHASRLSTAPIKERLQNAVNAIRAARRAD